MIVSFPAAVYYDFIVNVIRDKYYLPFYISFFFYKSYKGPIFFTALIVFNLRRSNAYCGIIATYFCIIYI